VLSKVTALGELVQVFLKNWSRNSYIHTGLASYYWPQVIGDALKGKTEVCQVKNGVLWIKTPDPALANNLTFFKKDIINKYRQYLGGKTIQGIRITVGEISLVDDFGYKGKTKKELPPPQDLPVPAAIETITDPDLKQAFSRFYYSHEKRKREVDD
jgi:hypothetical protein